MECETKQNGKCCDDGEFYSKAQGICVKCKHYCPEEKKNTPECIENCFSGVTELATTSAVVAAIPNGANRYFLVTASVIAFLLISMTLFLLRHYRTKKRKYNKMPNKKAPQKDVSIMCDLELVKQLTRDELNDKTFIQDCKKRSHTSNSSLEIHNIVDIANIKKEESSTQHLGETVSEQSCHLSLRLSSHIEPKETTTDICINTLPSGSQSVADCHNVCRKLPLQLMNVTDTSQDEIQEAARHKECINELNENRTRLTTRENANKNHKEKPIENFDNVSLNTQSIPLSLTLSPYELQYTRINSVCQTAFIPNNPKLTHHLLEDEKPNDEEFYINTIHSEHQGVAYHQNACTPLPLKLSKSIEVSRDDIQKATNHKGCVYRYETRLTTRDNINELMPIIPRLNALSELETEVKTVHHGIPGSVTDSTLIAQDINVLVETDDWHSSVQAQDNSQCGLEYMHVVKSEHLVSPWRVSDESGYETESTAFFPKPCTESETNSNDTNVAHTKNEAIYEVLKQLDFVQGIISDGVTIDVFINERMSDTCSALKALVEATGAKETIFNVKFM